MSHKSQELVMRFDPNTIEHLGIKMYSTLPPVIAEIVSNSYDAEAKKVKIVLFDDTAKKKIVISDDGHGMGFAEINSQFLRIGRNRRIVNNSQKSKNGKRLVIGKKGIGKLSFFGISDKIEIETISENKKNVFILDWEELKNTEEVEFGYKPKNPVKNQPTDEPSGTKITLNNVRRKTEFSPEHIAYSLSKSFQVFDEEDFSVLIFHNQDSAPVPVSNELRYKDLNIIHEWDFPYNEELPKGKGYYMAEFITGKVILTGNETVPSDMRGIALFSRNKLVNECEFYGNVATNHGYSYLTGWLNVDFIDMFDEDVISTNRRSLNWETEQTRELRTYLKLVIKDIYNQSRKIKAEKKVENFKEKSGIDVDEWIEALPNHEGKLARKIIMSIISSEGIKDEKSTELILFVKDSFQFESFKEIAKDFQDHENLSGEKIMGLLREWEIIEAREMYKLAIGRIETIKTFERLIAENAKEVQRIHPFFEKFPWVLDPRINMFRREVQYVKLLREKYPESDLDEKNRRIDFLCTSVSNHRFVIELKRPKHKIKLKDINQAKDYRSFVEEHLDSNKTTPNKVIAYIVGGDIDYSDRKTRDEIETIEGVDKVYVKTFDQLLTDAQNYHSEFIDRYEKMYKEKK